MGPRFRSVDTGAFDVSHDADSGVTLFASGPYISRCEALEVHRGRRQFDRPAHFILPLRRALARIATGAFDSPPSHPWRLAERRGGAFRLDMKPGFSLQLERVVEAAGALGLSVYDATTGETTQPMRLNRPGMIADALDDLHDDGYLILEGGPGYDIYVQALGEGAHAVQLEAVSQRHLPPDVARRLPRTEALTAMGFLPPTDENPNFFMALPRATWAERRHAAAYMVRALREAYGSAPDDVYRLRCQVLTEPAGRLSD